MPSNRKQRALRTLVREFHGGEKGLLTLMRSGWTCVRIARMLEADAAARGITRETIALSPDAVRNLLRTHDEASYHDAQKAGAESMVEEALALADDVKENRDAIGKVKLQTDLRLNVAGKLDRERWSDAPAVAVQVNSAGNLFLAAVMKPGAVPPPREPPKAALPPIDADVEEESEAMTAAYARTDREKGRQQHVQRLMKEYDLTLARAEALAAELEHGAGAPALHDQMPPGFAPPKPAANDETEEDA